MTMCCYEIAYHKIAISFEPKLLYYTTTFVGPFITHEDFQGTSGAMPANVK